jgi:HEPN domain-containing protein
LPFKKALKNGRGCGFSGLIRLYSAPLFGAMTRTQFQELAQVRIDDAKVLMAAGRFDGAYYLAGYAVECALKACIAQQFKTDEIPNKGAVDKIYVHNLDTLLALSKLDKPKELNINWAIVSGWSEHSRYDGGKSKKEVQDLLEAITNPTEGVLEWIRKFW